MKKQMKQGVCYSKNWCKGSQGLLVLKRAQWSSLKTVEAHWCKNVPSKFVGAKRAHWGSPGLIRAQHGLLKIVRLTGNVQKLFFFGAHYGS